MTCDLCPPDAPPDADALFAMVDGRVYCARHWHLAGQPWPRRQADALQLHETELATRERMTARGGTDRHLVRNGRT